MLPALNLNGQFSTFRSNRIAYADTIRLDTLSIVPNSFVLYSDTSPVQSDVYRIDHVRAELYIDLAKAVQQNLDLENLSVTYRVLAVNFAFETKDKQKHDLARTKDEQEQDPFWFYDPSVYAEPVNDFKFDGLTKSGSLTRGVSFGNAQDATVVSSFNLQLSGKLNNDVEILAAITDENIPIQPDGNTQTLQDFDRIYIQLSKGSTKAIGGDFIITKPEGYFLNMYKRAQGLGISTGFPNANIFKKDIPGSMKVGASGGIARGKFRRQELMGVEGNQGPYRLSGNQGEVFIVILSGSESVFIDGRRLERGQENDYIIDYNTGELTFTAKRLITKDIRIIVEFEYSDRNYQRWMVHANNEWEYKGFRYRINYFLELDDKNASLNQVLSDSERQILALAGDSIQSAVAPSADSVGFNTTEILYRKIDTVVNSQVYTIFEHSTNPDSAFFRVRFAYVGNGNGDYVLSNNLANGKVYQWIAPNPDGSRNGDFSPVTQLIAPKSQQLITLGADYRLNRNFSFDTEGALSVYDQNTFSSLHAKDNLGYAFKFNFVYRSNLRKKLNDTLVLETRLSYEQVDRNFKPFIRFRSVEFERDWNLTNSNNPNATFLKLINGTDYIPSVSLSLEQPGWGRFVFQSTGYLKGNDFSAYRNVATITIKRKRWEINFAGSQTATQDSVNSTLFLRQRVSVKKRFNKISFGINGETEYNAFYDRPSDSLLKNSYMFNDWEAFIGDGDSIAHPWKIFYKIRIDHLAGSERLQLAAIAHHAGGSFQLVNTRIHSFRTTLAYRYLDILDSTLLNRSSESSLLGRVEYYGKMLKNAVSLNLFYEIGSGLENRRDYQFIVSLNGLGTHVWIDYNGNGLQERDEYEIRSGTVVGTDGLTYVKFFIPTTEYVRTYYNEVSVSLNIKTPDSWKRKKGLPKFISRFSLQTVFRVNQKTQRDDLLASFNPFAFTTLDTALLSMNYSFRQSLFFNRFASKFGIELNYQNTRNKILLANGIDTRTNEYGSVRGRWNITRKLTLNLEGKYGNKLSSSEFLRNRDYNIMYWDIAPEFVVQPTNKYRITFNYRYTAKDNALVAGDTINPGGQRAGIHEGGIEFKTNFILKGQLQVKVGYLHMQYNDLANSPLAFEMLEGLKPGHNVTWTLSFQRTLGNNLQLTLNYDGRKSEATSIIHIGSMQLRAFF